MVLIELPDGFRLERLDRRHARGKFDCSDEQVNDWLKTKALQQQKKHLSVTKVLLDSHGVIAGYYTLATSQVDVGELPEELSRSLPRRALPVALLAWLGVNRAHQKQRLGNFLLVQALQDCYAAGQTFPFVAVVLDCLNETAKKFYRRWDFAELPGRPNRLFMSARLLADLMENDWS